MMPSGAAVPLLIVCFLVFACLLTIRVIERVRPHVSLAAVSMLCVFVVLASTPRTCGIGRIFYSVPIAASLLLSTLGLWLWMGAAHPNAADAGGDGGANTVESLSLPRLAAGSVCIAANVGCRPSFVVVAFAAFPLFWPQIRAIMGQLRAIASGSGVRGRARTVLHALRTPLAVLVPALVVVVPLFAYNMVRFSSPFDFGSSYQLTVTDMTSYHQSWSNFCLDGRILPVSAVALDGYVPVPCRRSRAFEGLGVCGGDARRPVRHGSACFGCVGLPVPT